jgi:glycosyltransferase involved in cell wall biosynthesis
VLVLAKNTSLNILYHHRTMARGAEGHHIRSIADGFRTLGNKVSIVSPPGIHATRFQSEFPVDKADSKETGIRIIWKFMSRNCPQSLFEAFEFLYNLWVAPKLLILSRRQGTDLLYERYAFFLWAGAFVSWIKEIPYFLEVNEISGLKRARNQYFLRLCTMLEKKIFQRANAIFVVSSSLKARLVASGIAETKLIVMPNAVDPQRFRSNPQTVAAIREKFNLQGCMVLGFGGWFDDWDNLETLLVQLGKIHSQLPTVRLMLVGTGRTLDRLIRFSKELGLQDVVVFTGPVERNQMPNYLDSMDICLIPDSNVFGSPIVLFEYMAMAKPIVARDLPPISDVILNDVNGILFKELKDGYFEKQILRLARDSGLRTRLGKNAGENVLQKHTWLNNSKRILDTYRLSKF